MYKVSIVIPIYNVENYIVRCAESLFNQTLDDIQFIFVDDATPDKSIVLLEQTLERFPQRKKQTIILHHPTHLGLPTARATGLARVEASYVAHCDSDDYVEPTMYARLYENAQQNNSDMVICGRIFHHADGRVISSFDKPNLKEDLIHNYLYNRMCSFVWCRLTKTDIYRKVHFPSEDYLEDFVQIVQLLTYAKRVSFLNECLYHYIQRPMSITTDTREEVIENKMRQCIINYYLMHDFVVAHHIVKEKDFYYKKYSVRGRFLPQNKKRGFREKYLQTFPELNFRLFSYQNVPLRHKRDHLLVLLGLYPIVKNTYDAFRSRSFLCHVG